LDTVLDHLHTLNDLTPKLKTGSRGSVDPELILSLDSKLFGDTKPLPADFTHHDEVETALVFQGSLPISNHQGHLHGPNCSHPIHDTSHTTQDPHLYSRCDLDVALSALSKEVVWRVKGFVPLVEGLFILNWAFGRYELVPRNGLLDETLPQMLRLTVMGERGEVKRAANKLAIALRAQIA
jgi:hypothetical protein